METTIYNEMLNKTMSSVVNKESQELVFTDTEGKKYVFYHSQDCCESVTIEDVCGDLSDLENSPILQAEEVAEINKRDDMYCDSNTWTFYKFATAKGTVVVRWYGSSNGYYSESVYFKIEDK